jgi:hypothetical protein
MKTALEQLIHKMKEHQFYLNEEGRKVLMCDLEEIDFDSFLKIEKKQIAHAFVDGHNDFEDGLYPNGEEYYDQTFKKDGQ